MTAVLVCIASENENMMNSPEFPSWTLVKRQLIVEALRFTEGNFKKAAELLDMGRTTLYRKIQEFEIQPEEWRPRKTPLEVGRWTDFLLRTWRHGTAPGREAA
jgi:hypothetical protein